MANHSNTPSNSRKRGKRKGRKTAPAAQQASTHGHGGRYQPLQAAEMQRLHGAALSILETIGLSEAPEAVIKLVCDHGGTFTDSGRLCFPPALVECALAGLTRQFTLHGQRPGHELQLHRRQVYVGSGGAAPMVVDLDSGRYRDSTLADLYHAARLVDALDNIHFFSRSLVARDMPSPLLLDINTAYASLAGTRKHVMTSASSAESVAAIADICFAIAGSAAAFVELPFLSLNINHVVSPLRFSAEACEVLLAAAAIGIPVHINTFGQLGASSPVTIAGCVSQTSAETLAGMIVAWLANPQVKAVFGPRPMVTDLRTGAMAGGAGEQALLTACCVQMADFLGLPNSTIAGATDSKIADAQSGYEKSLAVSLAAQSGCNLITQACGMQAGLMAASYESYVIDNDMLGSIMRTLSPIETSSEALAVQTIADVVQGDGHFLGQADTYQRMQTDFLYPQVADRRDYQLWEADGSPPIQQIARQRAKHLLASHYPDHLPTSVDETIRRQQDIRLAVSQMRRA